MKFRRVLIGLAWLLAGITPVLAAGIYTNGLPNVGAAGTTAGTGATVLPLTGLEQAPFDTQLTQGLNPASEAITVNQISLYEPALVPVTDAATITADASLGRLYTITLGGNRTLGTPTNLFPGKTFRLQVTQDGTGSRTLTYASLFKWTNGVAPTLSTTPGAVDLLTFVYNGTNLLGSSNLGLR